MSAPDRRTVLLVEDEFLIALDVCDMLERAGFEVLGPVPTIDTALASLTARRPDACVLDVNLRGKYSTPVADRLKAENVPFVLSSAYDQKTLDQYEAYRGIANVGKPAPAGLPLLIADLLR